MTVSWCKSNKYQLDKAKLIIQEELKESLILHYRRRGRGRGGKEQIKAEKKNIEKLKSSFPKIYLFLPLYVSLDRLTQIWIYSITKEWV